MFLPNFSTAILKNNIKSEKTSPVFLFLVLDLEKIIFLCFLCHAKKSSHTGNPGQVFVQWLCFSACSKFERIWKKFTKIEALQR